MNEVSSVLLHNERKYTEACADILNEEWPRSKTIRLRTLEKASADLPLSVVLLETGGCSQEVLGHARICKVQGKPTACFVESVVIKRSHRGRGLGRHLMDHTEKHAASAGFTEMYLSTHDKEKFYAHLGFEFSEPIKSLGANSKLISDEMFTRLFGNNDVNMERRSKPDHVKISRHHGSGEGNRSAKSVNVAAQPSPPVPPPPVSPHPPSSVPPPPPPPVPPPPPPNNSPLLKSSNDQPPVTYWMRKSLAS